MKKRMRLLVIAFVGMLVFSFIAEPPVAEAAVPVVDFENIMQQLKTFEQEAMTVINTAKQVELQYKELLNLPSQIMNSYKTLISSEIGQIQSLLTSTTGILNPNKKLDDLWISMFKPAGDLTLDTVTHATAAATNATTIKALDTVNYESFMVVKEAMKNITQTQSNIDQLLELNASAEGQKQTGQVQNMLLAEQAKLLQQQNLIRAAEANARITYYQRANQMDAIAQAICLKAADEAKNMDFTVTSK